MSETRGRQLLPGQTSRVHVYDVEDRAGRLVFASDRVLVEAPNVLDEDTLVLNADGDLWLLPLPPAGTVLDETALVPVPMDGAPEINNDHVLDPSGTSIVVSGRDGELYRVPMPDGGPAVRITRAGEEPVPTKYYLHGIAADGSSLAVVVGSGSGDDWRADVALVDPETGAPTFLTRDEHLDDGPSFAGEVLVFNTKRFTPGTAQLASLRPGASEPVRITLDDRVDWFPHVSPDGAHLLYLSYEPGTAGHPADRRVELRLVPGSLVRGARMMPVPEVLVALDGGQGTVNVPPWAPSSRWFAYCDYPASEDGRTG